jgi:hypothetical protein
MIDAIEEIDIADPVQTVKALDPVEPVNNRDGNTGSSDLAISSDIHNFFAMAIVMSFAQMGVFDTPAISSGDLFSSEPERKVLLEPFMGSLMNALQSQSALPYRSWIDSSLSEALQPLENIHPPLSWADTSLNVANSGTFGIAGYQEHHYYFHGQNEGLETDLQSLIQKVAAIDSGALTNESNNSALFSLFLNFQKLIRFAGPSGGIHGDITALGLFLKTLSKNIEGVNSTGNFIDIVD